MIDERWTNPTMELKKVRQFADEKFGDSAQGNQKNRMRTHSERYREAVRATHLIASEIADIEDEAEFETMLQFVLNQWRNVRQKKIAEDTPDGDLHEGLVAANVESVSGADLKREFGISNSDDEESCTGDSVDSAVTKEKEASASTMTIRLNPKARKVGAPKKARTKIVAGERADRKWYEAAEEGRKKEGEVTLVAVMKSLDHVQPGLREDPFYILPTKLLDACLKILPVSNSKEDAIAIDASQTSQPTEEKKGKPIETVVIKDVGSFSRKQIKTFKRVDNLKRTVQAGLDMHKWLLEVAVPSLPAPYHGIGTRVAEDVLTSYPFKRIQGLPYLADYTYAMLYSASPPTWLSDAALRALCLRLTDNYPTVRFAGFQSAVAKQRRSRKTDASPVEDTIRQRLLQQVQEDGVDTVLLPLNFDNFHWCCVVVKVNAKRIYYYDPLNHASYKNACNAVGTHLKISGLLDYDLWSWMFIRQVITGRHLEINDAMLTRRRFELFYYLLSGHLLPVETPTSRDTTEDDDTEEKAPAPRYAGEDDAEDKAPPTQRSAVADDAKSEVLRVPTQPVQ
ncbi:hypothetical protein PInf_009151 [Phytophthora infestans]|nr:hypothetical protein PInf_009151 [Phytophthora infestans]